MRSRKAYFRFHALTAVFLFVMVSCGPSQETIDQETVSLSVPKTTVEYTAASQFIKVTATSSWTLSIDCGSASTWAAAEQKNGTGTVSDIVFSWSENEGEENRSCVLTLTSGSSSSTVTFTQNYHNKQGGGSTDPSGLNPDTPSDWLELPATNDKSLFFFTHEMTLASGAKARNYSFCLDTAAKVAVWVAYPLNKSLIGSGSRTDQWGLDPKVPRTKQAVLYSGFRSGNQTFYQRGHQLPSADRLTSGVNETTFYGTNMTPQLGVLNEYAWATLEGKVRNWSYQLDTLYVVTGADIKGSTDYAYDNDGKKITVPVGYFKALLGYKKGGSIGNTTGGYVGIAFYFEHKGYSDNAIMSTQSMSIDTLEEKLGYDFFVNLSGKIGADLAAKVESAKDSWWQ